FYIVGNCPYLQRWSFGFFTRIKKSSAFHALYLGSKHFHYSVYALFISVNFVYGNSLYFLEICGAFVAKAAGIKNITKLHFLQCYKFFIIFGAKFRKNVLFNFNQLSYFDFF